MPFISSMTPGKLKHKIIIQEKTVITNNEGVSCEQWSDKMAALAEYVTQSSGEYFKDAANSAIEIALFRIRYRSGIDKTMRIKSIFGIFNITGVIDVDGKHRELQIQCTSEVQNG
ncbi:MAG: phage head closure protein [Clostridia bacterium]|jgi:SPP1 family predicted phage head-tail adaptor